jgi:uncharacterized protein
LSRAEEEWFDRPRSGERTPGLRFACTMCGHCCTGPEGYVLVSPDERRALAERFGISDHEFLAKYTKQTSLGLSLDERHTEHGRDCIFLDRASHPGRAICGVYEDRPLQCRTWPFWESNLRSQVEWERASRTCPGIGHGRQHKPVQIRVERAKIKI